MSSLARSGEIENPKVGDSVVSGCGMIKVSLAADGSFPVTKLTKKRGSFNIQLYFEGKKEPDTIVFKTDDPAGPLYRLGIIARLIKIKIVTNPV
jgi:hypothetical protein